MKLTARAQYVGLVVLTASHWHTDPNATIASLGAIEEQAAANPRLSKYDVDVVQELVDAWIRTIRNGDGVANVEAGEPRTWKATSPS